MCKYKVINKKTKKLIKDGDIELDLKEKKTSRKTKDNILLEVAEEMEEGKHQDLLQELIKNEKVHFIEILDRLVEIEID